MRREAKQRLRRARPERLWRCRKRTRGPCSTSCRFIRSNWRCRTRSCSARQAAAEEASRKYCDISQLRPTGESAASSLAIDEVCTPATTIAPAVVFDPELAFSRCFHNEDLVREMIQCFFEETGKLFPQMRAALAMGNLVELGRLGHRMKGTVVYLGAKPAEEAALRVEQFCRSSDGSPSEAAEAVNALERECLVLKAVLARHVPTIKAQKGRSP